MYIYIYIHICIHIYLLTIIIFTIYTYTHTHTYIHQTFINMYRRYLQVCASPGTHQTQPDNLAYPKTPPVLDKITVLFSISISSKIYLKNSD